jgi:hypothetical protein
MVICSSVTCMFQPDGHWAQTPCKCCTIFLRSAQELNHRTAKRHCPALMVAEEQNGTTQREELLVSDCGRTLAALDSASYDGWPSATASAYAAKCCVP